MLTQRELSELLERLRIPESGRKVIGQIRNAPPERRVRSGSCNVAARFPSRKMARTIQAESHTNELAQIYGWEHDPATFEFYDQPPRIRIAYLGASGHKRYDPRTVDFFLIQSDFIGWVECKTEQWLQEYLVRGGGLYEKNSDGEWISAPGNQYAESLGLGFRVLSSSTINRTHCRNLEFLADFLAEDCPEPDADLADHFIDQVRAAGHITLSDLIRQGTAEQNNILYSLIAQRRLFVDLNRHILAEPDSAIVFRSEAASAAYFAVEAGKQSAIARPQLPISLIPGEELNWDGQAWRLLNVGEIETTLVDAQGRLARLSRGDLEQLVRQGLVTGSARMSDPQESRALDVMLHASDADLAEALRRQRILNGEIKPGEKTPSTRMLFYWRKWAREGELLYGQAFLGLIRHGARKGQRAPRIDPTTADLLQKAVDRYAADKDGLTVNRAWGDLCAECEERGLIPPSERTFQRWLKRKNPHDVLAEREGSKAAYAISDYDDGPDYLPRHGDRPFQVAHIDHTQLDIQLVGRKFGELLHKPWLTLLIDAYTRLVLAYVITFDPPSSQSCMLVIRECLRRHQRMPQHIVSDGGKEFDSIYYEVLLARLRTTKKSRAASRPRYGAPIERWFGINNQQFVHQLRGNNRPLQNPRRMSKSHDPRTRAVWTLPEFTQAFETYLKAYHELEHSTLGVSPQQAMDVGMQKAGSRSHRLFPLTSALEIECLPSTSKGKAKVIPGRGVRIGVPYYTSSALKLGRWHDQEVEVRYDPLDISVAYAWLGDRWDALASEYASRFAGRSRREIELLTQEIRGKDKRAHTRRRLNATHLATALRSTEQSEAVLIQRQRDQELKASQANSLPANVTPLRPTPKESRKDSSAPPPKRIPNIKPLRSFE